jgi:hypothetical protein
MMTMPCTPLPLAAKLRARCGAPATAAAAAAARRRGRGLVVRASSDAQSPLPAALAIGLPVAAVAASSAVLSSGVISVDAVNAYFHTTAGFVFDADAAGQVPQFVKQYFHGANMALALGAMGGYGTYLGYMVRAGKGDEPTFGTPDTAAQLHPKLMTIMTLVFLAGGQGGVLFNLLAGKPILESPHAVTALAGLLLLAANAGISTVMTDSAQLRTAHAFLGSSLMAALLVHAGLGVKLALAF